jgi:hypothetical protein
MNFADGLKVVEPQAPLFMRDPNSGNDASNLAIDDIFDEFLFSNDQQRDIVKRERKSAKEEKGDFDDDDDYDDDYSLDGDNDGEDGNDSQGKKKKRPRGQQQRYMTEEQRIERR